MLGGTTVVTHKREADEGMAEGRQERVSQASGQSHTEEQANNKGHNRCQAGQPHSQTIHRQHLIAQTL
jgi:hypothetical protein